ncbi:MAG: hypothetical protein Q8Q33_00295 [Chlamydiota bacterium]|nr:hypothetical protein [Chlamydiota bacterium]
MEYIEKVIEQLSNETLHSLKEMRKAKDSNERKTQAEIVHLLCQSMSSLISSTASMMSEVHDFNDEDEDFEDEDEDFEDEDEDKF